MKKASRRSSRGCISAVELVNPPYQEPWRTQADYRRRQRRAARLYWFQILSIVAALVGVIRRRV